MDDNPGAREGARIFLKAVTEHQRMSNPISTRLRRWTPSDDGLHIIAADEIDRLTRELETATKEKP